MLVTCCLPVVLAQVVIDAQHVPALPHVFLADGASGVRRDVIHRRRLVGHRRHDDTSAHFYFGDVAADA